MTDHCPSTLSQTGLLKRFGRPLRAAACLIALLAATLVLGQEESRIELTDVSATTGIEFQHTDGSYGQYFLIESMSAGLALLDFDRDGDLDIYFLNGAPIAKEQPELSVEMQPRNALYRNDGEFHFVDVTQTAGVGDTHLGLGVAVGDYDNDGFTDIYVNNYGPNVFYVNNGDGTFREDAARVGVDNGTRVGGGAAFFDKDSDGDLDLYVGNYIRFDPTQHRVHMHKGLPAYPSPLSFEPDVDTLFENNGDGSFSDVSASSGIQQVAGRSMGLVAFDYDDDGDIDVYVANDTQENHLFENDGRGHFEEVALVAGVALDYQGKAQASMGVELCDVDRDGRLDLLLTSFSEEFVTLYHNAGDGFFDDITLRTPALAATFPHVTWGIIGEDFDNNGYPDILIGAGDLDVNRSQRGGTSQATAYRVPNIMLANPSGALRDLQAGWGNAAAISESTRGLLGADLNNDGWIDVVALNARSRPSILKNETHASDSKRGGYLQVELCGTQSNRDGLGASVVVRQAQLSQVEQKHSGHSYQCDLAAPLHFGLSSPSQPVQVNVQWPSGKKSEIEVMPNTRVIIIEQ